MKAAVMSGHMDFAAKPPSTSKEEYAGVLFWAMMALKTPFPCEVESADSILHKTAQRASRQWPWGVAHIEPGSCGHQSVSGSKDVDWYICRVGCQTKERGIEHILDAAVSDVDSRQRRRQGTTHVWDAVIVCIDTICRDLHL